MKNNKIVVSGIRPTNKIHIGNYNSVIKNWIKLQENYNCFFFIADIHALTTDIKNINNIAKNTKYMIIELLALGLDPNKSNIFIQSHIPEIFELHTIISMITKINRLERIPSYKDDKNENKTYGFLGYPVLQAADVISLNSNYIPIGEDQIPHIELIKEITKSINKIIFKNENFKINNPIPLLSDYPKIIGIDGFKMSKSRENTIFISDTSDILKKKINKFITDPNRIYKTQKGNPKICPIFSLQKIYNEEQKENIENECENAKLTCEKCKEYLYIKMNIENEKILKNIIDLKKNKKYIEKTIKNGIKNTRIETKKVLKHFKKKFNI